MNEKAISLRLMKFVLTIWWWGTILIGLACVAFMFSRIAERAEFSLIGYASDIDTTAFAAEDRKGRAVSVSFPEPVKVRLRDAPTSLPRHPH